MHQGERKYDCLKIVAHFSPNVRDGNDSIFIEQFHPILVLLCYPVIDMVLLFQKMIKSIQMFERLAVC